MKFVSGGSINGTSLRGYVESTYDELVKIFGQPTYGPDDNGGDKVTCEWVLTFEDGTVATIYDWKLYYTPTDLYSWHIGGYDMNAVWRVKEIVNGKFA